MNTKWHNILLVVYCIGWIPLHAQYINEDAKGESSIIFPGSTLSFDISQTDIQLGYLSQSTNKNQTLHLGFHIQAKNNKGLSNLVSSGKLQPFGRASFLFLKDWSLFPRECHSLKEELNKLSAKKDSVFAEIVEMTMIICVINGGVLYDTNWSSWQRKPVKLAEKLLADTSTQVTGNTKSYKDNLRKAVNEWREYSNRCDERQKKIAEICESKTCVNIISLFAIPYLSATNYFLFNMASIPGQDPFRDSTLISPGLEVGVNIHFKKRVTLGLSMGVERASNISSLKSAQYLVQTVTNINGQDVIREKEYDAYDLNAYRIYGQFLVKADIARRFILQDSSSLFYDMFFGRLNVPFDASAASINLDVGTGVYFIDKKQKFVGGAYFQYTDVTNERGNVLEWYEKFAFGITARFNIQSILMRSD